MPLNIAVIYTSKIPFFNEHFASFHQTGINIHATDCFLVLGNEYNEDIEAFKKSSIFNTTTILIENDYCHEKKAAELIITKKYDLVIHVQTQLLFKCDLNWDLIMNYLNDTSSSILANKDDTFTIGSQSAMIEYLSSLDSNLIPKKGIEFEYSVKPITIEKYNTLFGFRGLSEVCDSYKYISDYDDAGNYSMDLSKIQPHDTVYFTNLSLRRLHKQIILITKPFILVSGGGDCECPNQIFETDAEFQTFINSPNIFTGSAKMRSSNTQKSHPFL